MMTPPRTQLISVKDVAAQLGVSPFTVRAWLRERRIPFVKLGRRVLLRVEDVQAFLAKNYKAATRPW